MYIFKRHNLRLIFAIPLLAMAAVACRDVTPPLASPPTLSPSPIMTSTPTLQPTPSPTEPIAIPTPPPEASCPSCGSIEEQARETLADWLGVSSEEIEVLKVEEVEWPDTSLGCPQPGMVYAQVITLGFKVVMRVRSKVFEYHTDRRGRGVLCDQEGHLISVVPSPTVTPITVPSVPTPTIDDVCAVRFVFPHGRLCPTPRTPHD